MAEALGLVRDARAEARRQIAGEVQRAEQRAYATSLRQAEQSAAAKRRAAAGVSGVGGGGRGVAGRGASGRDGRSVAAPQKQPQQQQSQPQQSQQQPSDALSWAAYTSSKVVGAASDPLGSVGSGLDTVRISTNAAWQSTQVALGDPNDPSSRRVLGGAAGGFVAVRHHKAKRQA